MINKKIEALAKEFNTVADRHDKAIQKLTEAKAKASAKLEEINIERASAMESGDLAKARKLKAEIIDLESDVETYTIQIRKAEEAKSVQMTTMADRIMHEVKKELDARHDRDRAELIRHAREVNARVDEGNKVIEEGNGLIVQACTVAGYDADQYKDFTMPGYLGVYDGKRLIIQSYKVNQSVIDVADKVQGTVQGVLTEHAQKWI